MSHLSDEVSRLLHELEQALRAHLDEEHAHGVPRDVAAETVLRSASPWLTRQLDHLPTLASPWRVVDMRDGSPTKLVRDGWRDTIATVREERQRKGRPPRWSAFVGGQLVCPPDDSEYVDWPTREAAQAACDAQLVESGVVLEQDGGAA